MPLPKVLQLQGLKPWDIKHIDTLDLWKFGDVKNFSSLNLLAHVLGIPSPKDDIDGSMVGALYWSESDREANLKRIAVYCQKDVITTGNIILRFRNMPPVPPEDIRIVE